MNLNCQSTVRGEELYTDDPVFPYTLISLRDEPAVKGNRHACLPTTNKFVNKLNAFDVLESSYSASKATFVCCKLQIVYNVNYREDHRRKDLSSEIDRYGSHDGDGASRGGGGAVDAMLRRDPGGEAVAGCSGSGRQPVAGAGRRLTHLAGPTQGLEPATVPQRPRRALSRQTPVLTVKKGSVPAPQLR